MKKYIIAISFFLSSFSSFGAGFQLNLQGLRQLAMGGTGTAWTWDASTIFYNPGGLANINHIQFYGSILNIMPSTAFANQTVSSVSVKQSFTPFNFYLGGTIKDGSPWALGLGVYTPFGSGLQWEDNWTGRFIIQSTQMKCFFVQPTVSYRVGDALSVGLGVIYANGIIDISQALPVQDLQGNDQQVKLHGNGYGLGFNAGAHLKLGDELQLGLTYRSQVNMVLDGGSAKFTVPQSLTSEFPNTTWGTLLPLPQVLSFGIGIRTSEMLSVHFDLNFTGWAAYDSMRITFNKNTSSLHNISAPRMYKNTFTPRLGLNFKVSNTVSLMCGAAYDASPVPDGCVSPDLPDADRIVLTCGLSVKPVPGLTILAAFEGVTSYKRNASYDYGNFAGIYQTMAATPGIGFYYNF